MPAGRPTIDYEALKPKIVRRYHLGQNCPEIVFELGGSVRTMEQRIQKWGLHKRVPKINIDDPMLRSHIAIYFMSNLTDAEMVFALKQQGWQCTLRQVARIRKSQGIQRRFSAFERQVAVNKLWKIIEKELDSGSIKGYSQKMLHVHFKRLGHQLS